MRGATVAKKAGRPRKAGVDPRQPRRIVIQATPEWDDWLDRVATKLRTTKSGAVDRILSDWAEANEFELPPPRT